MPRRRVRKQRGSIVDGSGSNANPASDGSEVSDRGSARASDRDASPARSPDGFSRSPMQVDSPESPVTPVMSPVSPDSPKSLIIASPQSAASGDKSPVYGSVDSGSQDIKPVAFSSEMLFGGVDDLSSSSSESEDVKLKVINENGKTSDECGVVIKQEKVDVDHASDADIEKEVTAEAACYDAIKSDPGSISEVESDGEQKVEEDQPETRMDIEIPKITADLGKAIHYVKLPNFLSFEPRPFDSNGCRNDIEDEEGKPRPDLKVGNTVRWRERFNEKGEFVRESNTRFVKWSDGSLTLHVGSEAFNIDKQPLPSHHNHLFCHQNTVLQGQSVFGSKLTFKPHSKAFRSQTQSSQGIKVIPDAGPNPDSHREEMIKQEEDRLRSLVSRESQQRRIRERFTGRGGRLSARYLEHDFDEDDDGISLAAIKNRYKKGNLPGQSSRASIISSDGYEDENEGSDTEDRVKARKLEKAKALKISDDEEDEEGAGSSSGSR